ncbi:MAG: tRNA lysidine(34) synthetase TilS [Gammaproteobacteria bacterium]|nr:tRNA lysidine(34) synthetase TilS [Gammaproteobacteria bacterium]
MRLVIAYSGGLDSTTLLASLAGLAGRDPLPELLAVHVDHGLHPDSASWAAQCARQAGDLGVDIDTYTVSVEQHAGLSREAAAREARYELFHEVIGPGDVLLTAHHLDDQAETFLLMALRGSGPAGLAAMPARAGFGQGHLCRPLLDFDRAALEAWAREQGLEWLEDPSNADQSLDRNFLRHRVLPLLAEQWPQAARTLARAARHSGAAAELLHEAAAHDLERNPLHGECLPAELLLPLGPERQRNLVREWLRVNGLRMPSSEQLERIFREIVLAAPDARPRLALDGRELRRFRGVLYLVDELPVPEPVCWQQDTLVPAPGLGRLRRLDSDRGLPPGPVEVRYRQGGERLTPEGRSGHHELKKLLQEAGVLPWWRDRIPLLYRDDELLAVGDIWLSEEHLEAGGWRPAWDERPRLLADEYRL